MNKEIAEKILSHLKFARSLEKERKTQQLNELLAFIEGVAMASK